MTLLYRTLQLTLRYDTVIRRTCMGDWLQSATLHSKLRPNHYTT